MWVEAKALSSHASGMAGAPHHFGGGTAGSGYLEMNVRASALLPFAV